MGRDLDEVDAPQWSRGAVMEKRLFGISNYNGTLQYSIMAGGVCQWHIMPRRGKIIGKGEKLTHVLSWRGMHHLVFTENNIWRIDLADGDIFKSRDLDTFAGRGTALWRSIINHPTGVYFVAPDGIWAYQGEAPKNIIERRWLSQFLSVWAPSMTSANTVGAVNGRVDDLWFKLGDTEYIWIFRPREDNWRKYQFSTGEGSGLVYGTNYYGAFLVSLEPGGIMEPSSDFVDTFAETSVIYSAHGTTQELPPTDETSLTYWQYVGIRYGLSPNMVARLRFLMTGYDDAIQVAPYMTLPHARKEYFAPMPKGVTRALRIQFGQGDVFGDQPEAGPVIIRMFSLRATGVPQWGGTR